MDLRYLRSSLVLPTTMPRAVAPSQSVLRFACRSTAAPFSDPHAHWAIAYC